jgi:hypothetical protein
MGVLTFELGAEFNGSGLCFVLHVEVDHAHLLLAVEPFHPLLNFGVDAELAVCLLLVFGELLLSFVGVDTHVRV